MFVIARNSTFTYKGKPVKVQQVSEDLGVRYVLEGSVQKSGDRVMRKDTANLSAYDHLMRGSGEGLHPTVESLYCYPFALPRRSFATPTESPLVLIDAVYGGNWSRR